MNSMDFLFFKKNEIGGLHLLLLVFFKIIDRDQFFK